MSKVAGVPIATGPTSVRPPNSLPPARRGRAGRSGREEAERILEAARRDERASVPGLFGSEG